ncbi:MAG: TolC family protein [Thermoanaerobaculum sp.]
MGKHHVLAVVFSVMLGHAVWPRGGGEVPSFPGFPLLAQKELSLAEALRLTLVHEPNLALAREEVKAKGGLSLQAAGAFDLTLLGTLSYEFTQRPLSAAEKLDQQKKRDELRREIAQAEAKVAQYDQMIQQLLQARSDLQNGLIPAGVNFLDPQTQAQWEALLALYRNAPPAQQAQIRQDIIDWIESRLGELTIAKNEEQATAIGDRDELRKLGPIAEVEQTQKGTLDLQLSKRYRTGLTLAPFIQLTGESLRYQGKPKSDVYGGPGREDTYNATIGFSVTVPLGRGRGVESAAAAEQASLVDWEASRKTLAFTASKSVLATVFAYLDLYRAQETVAVYERSLELQQRLAELVQALVDADEIPRAELSRMEARKAEVASQVHAARASLAQAQVGLATTMGVALNGAALLPKAVDGFPEPPDRDTLGSVSLEGLTAAAAEKRLDVAAARDLERSGKVLWRAAVIDLAAKKDLDFKVSYAGLSDAGGNMGHNLGRALFGNWAGPSAGLTFAYEKPVANLTQRGQMEQRQALWQQRQISAADLERRVRLDVVQTFVTLKQLLPQFEAAKTSARAAREAFDNELEKLRYGRSTLVDTILTEQRAVEADLGVIQAQFAAAQTLAKLRFDTGNLVEETPAGEFRVLADLFALPRAGR